MAESNADIVMKFVKENGHPVSAESTLGVLGSDDFMDGFKAASDYHKYSNFFEVTSFNYSMQSKPDDQNVGSLSKQPAAMPGRTTAAADGYSRWRSASESNYKDIKFPIEFDTFSFTRVIDGASPLFFEGCCNQLSFASATLVKRVSAGSQGGKDMPSLGFLRFEFTKVMITDLSWDDGDLVTESCSFICRNLVVKYRQQGMAGKLVSTAPPATWPRKSDRDIKQPGDS